MPELRMSEHIPSKELVSRLREDVASEDYPHPAKVVRGIMREAADEIERLRSELLGISLSYEANADSLRGRAQRVLRNKPTAPETGADETQALDAARWRAFVRVTGHEVDMSSGPGKAKDLHVRINCTGCERYLESGAPDY